MAPLRRVKLTELNAHLVCVLCSGYFVDATTIIECLHTFCKTCIVRYLSTSSFCPICDVQVHKTRPLLSLREDRTLQDVVFKLVPGLHHSETSRRHHFYNEHPEAGGDKTEQGLRERRHFFHVDDQISLSLEYLPPSTTTNSAKPLSLSNGQVSVANKLPDGTLPGSEEVQKQDHKNKMDVDKDEKQSDALKTPVHKRFLKCPAAVQVSHLEKFVRLKYGLSTNHKVDIMHGGDCLLSDLTLLDVVYMYKWQEDEPLRLFYTISAPVARKRLRNNGMRTRTNVDSEQPVTKLAKLQNPEGEVTAETLGQHQTKEKTDDQSTLNEESGDGEDDDDDDDDDEDSMSIDDDPLEQEKRRENADLSTIDTSDIFGSMNTYTFNLPSVPPIKTKNVQHTKENTSSPASSLASTTHITTVSKTSAPIITTVNKTSAPVITTVSKTSAPITPVSTTKPHVPTVSKSSPVLDSSNKPVCNKSAKPASSTDNLVSVSSVASTTDGTLPISSVESSTTLSIPTKSPPLSKLSITKTSDGNLTSKFTSGDNSKPISTSASRVGKENTSTTNSTTVVTSSSSKPKAPNRVLPKLTATLPTASNLNTGTNVAPVSTPNISSAKSTSPKTVTFSLASDPVPKSSVVTSISRTDITPKFVSLAQSNTKITTTNSVVNSTANSRPTNSTQLVNSVPEKPLSPIIPTKPRLGRPPNASRIAAAALGTARLSAPRGVDMKPPRAPAPVPQSANKVALNQTVASLNVQSRLSSISGGPPRTGTAKLTVKRTQDAKIQPPTPNMVSCPSPRPESSTSMTSILSPVTSTPYTTTTAGSNIAITQTSRANAVSTSKPNLIFTSRTSSPSVSNSKSMLTKSSSSFSSATNTRPTMTSCPSPRPLSVTSNSPNNGMNTPSQKLTTVSAPSNKSVRPGLPSSSQPNMASCPSPRPNMASCPSPRPNMASCPSPRPNMASCPSPRPNMASCPSPRPNMASCPSPRPNMASCPSPRPNMASCPSPRPNMASCPSPRPNMVSCPSPRQNTASNSPQTSINSSTSPLPNMVSCSSPRPNMASCPSPRPNMASCPSPRPNMVSCPSPRPNLYSFDMSSGRPQIPPSPRPHTLATPSPRQTTSRTNIAISKNAPQPQSPLTTGANISARPAPSSTPALQKLTQPLVTSSKTQPIKPSNNKTPKSPRRGGNSPTILSIAQTLTNRAVQQQTTTTTVRNGSLPITTPSRNTPVVSTSTSPGLRSPPATSITTNALGYPSGINPALATLAAGGAMGGMNSALIASYLASQGLASQSLASAYSDPSLQDVATMRNLITLSQTAALLRDTNLAALVQQAQQNQVTSASPPQPEPAPIDLSPTSKAAPVTALTNGRSKESFTTTNAPSQKSKNSSVKSTKSPKSSNTTINISAPTAEVTITKLPSSSEPTSTTTTTGTKSVPPLVKVPKSNTNTNTVSITKRPVSSNKYAVAKSPANASLRQIPNPSLLRQQSEVRNNNNNNNNKNTSLVQTSTPSSVNGKGTSQYKKVAGNSPLKETGPLPETSSILKIEHLTRSLPTAAIAGQNQYRFFEGR
ncbi:unnamed protein product, partial [Meganyctiphanes norvegica]